MNKKLSLLALRFGFVVALVITVTVVVEIPEAVRSILRDMREPTHMGLAITPEHMAWGCPDLC